MKNITLKQAIEIMQRINEDDNFSCYFEGKGNMEVSLIVESNVIEWNN